MTAGNLVSTDCDLCGSGRRSLLFEKSGLNIVRCDDCGLVCVNPRPDSDHLKNEVYDEKYFSAERGYGIEDLFGKSRLNAKARAESLFTEIERSMKVGAVLDVGCAAGFFLDVASRRGWRTTGAEISDYAAASARESLGLDVLTGDFTELDIPPGSFDLVLMLDVIEHFTSPAKALEKAREVLSPRGMLVIETPNFDSPPARRLGPLWGLVAPEHHLFYFTPETMDRMLKKTGFEIESLEFPRWGLTDLLLSAGAIQKSTGLPAGEKQKSFVRRHLRAPRDAARALTDFVDRALLVPVFSKKDGVTLKIIARTV